LYKTADVQFLIISIMILLMSGVCIGLKWAINKAYNASPTSPDRTEKIKLKTKLKSLVEELRSWFYRGGWRL